MRVACKSLVLASPYAPMRHIYRAELANILDGNTRVVALNAPVISTCTVLDEMVPVSAILLNGHKIQPRLKM